MKFLKTILFGIAAVAFSAPAFASALNVPMNQSTVVRLEGSASTVVVGNPMIADVSVVAGNTLVVQGRVFGNTDVLVLDSTGAEIANISVVVTDNWRGGLTLTRGTASASYVCARDCNRVLRPGDGQAEAEVLGNQTRMLQDITQRGMMVGEGGSAGE